MSLHQIIIILEIFVKDYIEEDYIEEDYVEEDYDEDILSQDVLNIKLDDYVAKLTQTELKQYLKLKQRIKESGEEEDAISFKGKNFVLTEVEELELMGGVYYPKWRSD